MKRSDREIHDKSELKEILDKADVCRIAFNGKRAPYIAALNFGFEWDTDLYLYFHCAPEGKKIEFMKRDNLICFQVDIEHELIKAADACGWGMRYRSVVGSGLLTDVTDEKEKKHGLDLIMEHYGHKGEKIYSDTIFTATHLLKLHVEELAGKKKV